jgi:hypothetical protein
MANIGAIPCQARSSNAFSLRYSPHLFKTNYEDEMKEKEEEESDEE